ncbi:hypothetical protein BC834DRAFT_946937 [Gloeopeniophorella convolvens]|nr:hypothetical protein BC834DRAFT_946937 [Gloeopeniophorella convolvens]
MASVASHSHTPDAHAVADIPNHASPHSSKSLLASTWQVLDQPPPPSLREILGAYRSRGDGDREMLMAMLNAKSAEDQRIASVASLHRSMLEYYQISSRSMHEAPYSTASDQASSSQQNGAYQTTSAGAPRYPYQVNDTPAQRSGHPHAHKRVRTSESPPSTYRSIPSSYAPSPPPGPPSPYSSRSDSTDQSPDRGMLWPSDPCYLRVLGVRKPRMGRGMAQHARTGRNRASHDYDDAHDCV